MRASTVSARRSRVLIDVLALDDAEDEVRLSGRRDAGVEQDAQSTDA